MTLVGETAMRLAMSLLTILAFSIAGTPDLTGVWVADIAQCNFGTSPRPNKLALKVARDGEQLKVIEVSTSADGEVLSERNYVFQNKAGPMGPGLGRAKTTGQTTVLQSANLLERWRISENGSKLLVRRWIGVSPSTRKQVLVFRRSQTSVE